MTKTPKWLLSILSALFVLSALTACSSSEGDSSDDPEQPKPDVPIDKGDWQTVPASGGTIEKDSLSITFPSGTFSEDAKVAITEVKKGEIGGEFESSKFYQITMPCTASKPITLKMKSNEKDDNICFVAQAEAFSVCSGQYRKVEHHYDTSYSNGEYSATIPAIKGDTDDNLYFTIGLGRVLDPSKGKAQTRAYKNQVLYEGKIGNVNYQIRYMWTIYDQIKWSLYGDETFDKVIGISGKVHKYVKQSITKILDLGFEVEGSPTLYIDFDTSEDGWGGHQFCGLPLSTSWSSYVSLGTEKLFEKGTTDVDIKCTVIHEIFHWFQSFYDPRNNWKKVKCQGEEIVFYEMGGVWIENLMNGGQLNGKYISDEVLDVPASFDNLGLTDVNERWNDDDIKKNDIKKKYRKQGYLQGPLLYYLCSSNEMKEFGFKNESAVALHNTFSAAFNVSVLGSDSYSGTINVMDDWAKIYHDSHFFTGNQIDDYYVTLFSGKLIKGVSAYTLRKTDKTKQEKFSEPFEGITYPYGCAIRKICLKGMKDISLKKSKLVVKQESEGVSTRLLITDRSSKYEKFTVVDKVVTSGDSIVLDGKKLESLRLDNGSYDHYFFLVTTRKENTKTDSGKMPWKATIELRDVEEETDKPGLTKTDVEFEAEGGTDETVKIKKASYKYCGVDDLTSKEKKWLKVKAGDDGTLIITAQPNEKQTERKGSIKCWVSKKKKPGDADKQYVGEVSVLQKAKEGNGLLDTDKLDFPVEGGVKFIGYSFGSYQWLNRQWEDDTWLRTAWSKDYVSNISYNPSSENRYANQLYVCCFPNETGKEREQDITFGYAYEKDVDFEKRDHFPVKVKQEGGSFHLSMMNSLFVGRWYTARDIEYNKSEGHYYHRRYTFLDDNTIILEGQTTKSTLKPSSWKEEFYGLYSIKGYEVKGECVKVYIEVPKEGVWYNILIERWPHFIYFAYVNSDGSLAHGVYLESDD